MSRSASGLRIVALDPLWGSAALPMLWFIWGDLRLAFAGDLAPVQHSPVPGPQALSPE